MGLMARTSSQEASNVDEGSHGVSLLGEGITGGKERVVVCCVCRADELSGMSDQGDAESPSFYRRLDWQSPHATATRVSVPTVGRAAQVG